MKRLDLLPGQFLESEDPYGDFEPHDHVRNPVREVVTHLGRPLTDQESARHRALCDRCRTYAVLTSEIV